MNNISNKRVNISKDNIAITFNNKNCDECGICKNICKFNVGVYDFTEDKELCINCGSCTIACPKKCLTEKDETDKLRKYLHSNKIIVIQTAPAVRVSLGEEFSMKEKNVEGKMITALRQIGADYVFDTTFGADLTIMEEANELVNRIKSQKNLPLFTSCCPSWVKFCEIFYPEYLPNLSTCKSPISMMGAVINNYFCKINNLDRKDIISIAVVPCTSKKVEIKKYNDIDLAITTRELARYLKEEKINFSKLKNGSYNNLLGKGSGSGLIFGTSGGVTEATLREVYHILNKRYPKGRLLNFKLVRGLKNVKEAKIKINGITISVAAINGTGDARKVIEKLKEKEVYYDFIEVMTCEGGCISGGGQPTIFLNTNNLKQKRMNSLYKSDKRMKLRCASMNPDIKEIYDNFLGEAGSNIALKYLHTEHRKEEENE